MSILTILIVLLIIGLLLPQLGVALDPTIKKIIVVVLIVLLLLFLFGHLGVLRL